MLSTIRLLLIAAVIVLAVMWYRGRDRRVLWWLGGSAAALALLFAITGLVYLLGGGSVKRQIVNALEEMAVGVRTRDLERIFAHVSDSFELNSGTTKPMLREFARQHIDNGEVSDLKVWDFGEVDVVPASANQPATAKIHFKVKPRIDEANQPYWDCDAVFVMDADGQWRLKSFQVFLPQRKDPYPIPQLTQ